MKTNWSGPILLSASLLTSCSGLAQTYAVPDVVQGGNQSNPESGVTVAARLVEDEPAPSYKTHCLGLPAGALLAASGRPGAIRTAPSDEATIRALVAQQNSTLSYGIERLEVAEAGDMAYEVGTYTLSRNGVGQTRARDKSSYVRVWRKTGGQWLIDVYVARTDDPGRVANR